MNTGHKTVAAMLALVAVLLGVNIVQGPRAAEAQGAKGNGDPYVVKYLTPSRYQYIRVWSDGQVDMWQTLRRTPLAVGGYSGGSTIPPLIIHSRWLTPAAASRASSWSSPTVVLIM